MAGHGVPLANDVRAVHEAELRAGLGEEGQSGHSTKGDGEDDAVWGENSAALRQHRDLVFISVQGIDGPLVEHNICCPGGEGEGSTIGYGALHGGVPRVALSHHICQGL